MNDNIFKIVFVILVILPIILASGCLLISLMTDESKYAKYSVGLCIITLLGFLVIGILQMFLS